MSLRTEMEVAQIKVLGKYCHACNKFKPKEEFTAMRKGKPGKCDVCMSKHVKPKAVAITGAPERVKHVYRG